MNGFSSAIQLSCEVSGLIQALGRIGGDSNDAKAGNLDGLFDFHRHAEKLILDPSTGDVISRGHD